MDWVVDSAFSIGRKHKVCEDYAYHSNKDIPIVAIADGCSSSPDTDIGARILVQTVMQYDFGHYIFADKIDDNYFDLLGEHFIRTANAARQCLSLKKTVLDTTLLVALKVGTQLCVGVFGDGFVMHKYKNDPKVYIRKVGYENEAPYYLSYRLDKIRALDYKSAYGESSQKIVDNLEGSIVLSKYSDASFFSFPLSTPALDLEFVAVSSDGLDSFVNMDSQEPIPAKEIIAKLCDFKVLKGEFVKRTFHKALRRMEKENIYPTDDVSLAVIHRSDS